MLGSYLVYKYGEDLFNCKLVLKCRVIIIFFEKKKYDKLGYFKKKFM